MKQAMVLEQSIKDNFYEEQTTYQCYNELENDLLIRGTRSFYDIY
jgi:hypothetical protein